MCYNVSGAEVYLSTNSEVSVIYSDVVISCSSSANIIT